MKPEFGKVKWRNQNNRESRVHLTIDTTTTICGMDIPTWTDHLPPHHKDPPCTFCEVKREKMERG